MATFSAGRPHPAEEEPMRNRPILTLTALAGLAAIALMPVATSGTEAPRAGSDAQKAQVARGKYLATIMLCNDCHTPWKMGEKGPEPDMSRLLSGHPQDLVMPPPPALGHG